MQTWTATNTFVALLTVEYALHGKDSLKGKRRVADSLKQKLRNQFNVSVAETSTADSLTRLRLAAASVSNEEFRLQSRMNKRQAVMEAVCAEEIIYSDVEIHQIG